MAEELHIRTQGTEWNEQGERLLSLSCRPIPPMVTRSSGSPLICDGHGSFASEWEDSVIDNIDEEYNRLVEHLHDSARKTESTSCQETSKTFELMRQRGIARATGNRQQTSDFAMLCRERNR
uniref:Uncharacterized protein n=1 Tax=Haemonchus contortus TaxID=6289 RepID=A0A7I4Z6W6_HAECO